MAWLSGCVLYEKEGRKSLFCVQGESNVMRKLSNAQYGWGTGGKRC